VLCLNRHITNCGFSKPREVRLEVVYDAVNSMRQRNTSDKQNYQDDVWKNCRKIHNLNTHTLSILLLSTHDINNLTISTKQFELNVMVNGEKPIVITHLIV